MTELISHLCEILPPGLHRRTTTTEQIFRESSVRQHFRDCRGPCPLICLSLTVHRYFWKQWTQQSNYKEVAVRKVCHPPSRPTSHSGHMGAYLNQQTAFLAAVLNVCTPLLSLAHACTHALAFESSKSPFILQNPHTLHPVCQGTLHQHTHSLQPMHSQTHTSQRAPFALLPLHLAGAICSTHFVSGWWKAAPGWWCCGALSWLVEEL